MNDVTAAISAYRQPGEDGRNRLGQRREIVLDAAAVVGGLKRHKWLIFACLLLGTTAAIGLAVMLEPRYKATASVMIEPRQPRLFENFTTSASTSSLEEAAIETQAKVLGSRSTVHPVFDSLGLSTDLEINPDVAAAEGSQRSAPWRRLQDAWRAAITRIDQPPAETAALPADHYQAAGWTFPPPQPGMPPPVTDEATFQRFMGRLNIRREGQSSVLSVSFTSADAGKAARIANAVVDSYLSGQLRAKGEAAQATVSVLINQAERLREQVLEAEKAAEQYRANHDLLDGKDGSLVEQQLAAMNSELIQARNERISMETKLHQVESAAASRNGYRTVPEIVAAPGIVRLLERESELLLQEATMVSAYGEKNPGFIELKAQKAHLAEKINRDVNNIIRGLEGQAAVARAREQVLEERLAAAKTESASARGAGLQLRELEREAASMRAVYDTVLLRIKEDQQEKGLLQPDARVISAAVAPSSPTFPKLSVMVAVGFTGSVLLALVMVALREHLNHGLRTGRQVEQALSLPNLALIPRLKEVTEHTPAHRYLLEKPRSVYAAAIKALEISLKSNLPAAVGQVVLITSSLPGEGKTTLSMSLAASFARSGSRTVLVDLDLRHPSIGRIFGHPMKAELTQYLRGQKELDEVVLREPEMHPMKAELTQYLRGQKELDEVVLREPEMTDLHYIPVAAPAQDPLDLLTSATLTNFIATLRSRYEFVVIDTPPSLGVADPSVVAPLADVVIFVVQWQKTTESAASNGLEVLKRSGSPLVGVALTQVDIKRHATYGYGDVGEYYGCYQNLFTN